MTKTSHAAVRLHLAQQRQMTSLIEKELIAEGSDLELDTSGWVPVYLDRGYAVTSDCGTMTAYRAVTIKGQLLWVVFSPDRVKGHHATTSDPFEAMEQARQSRADKRTVCQNWSDVERMAQDLIWGRAKFEVRIEDICGSPRFILAMKTLRPLFREGRIPGRLAALLMKIEPQIGFAIHAAERRKSSPQVTATEQEITGLQV